MIAQYKNIVILSMSFDPDQIVGLVDGKKFKADILTDNNGQYILVNGDKYYLSKLIYSK